MTPNHKNMNFNFFFKKKYRKPNNLFHPTNYFKFDFIHNVTTLFHKKLYRSHESKVFILNKRMCTKLLNIL